MFESETALEFFIKVEEDDEDFQESRPFTNQSSMENNQCDDKMPERRTDVLCCNIKQEEAEDDFGIIEGFLDNTDDDMHLENENENQRLMQENHFEDLHSQVSKFL